MKNNPNRSLGEKLFDLLYGSAQESSGTEIDKDKFKSQLKDNISGLLLGIYASLFIIFLLLTDTIEVSGNEDDMMLLMTGAFFVLYSINRIPNILAGLKNSTLPAQEPERKKHKREIYETIGCLIIGVIIIGTFTYTSKIQYHPHLLFDYNIEYEDLGIKITVPAGWTKPEWEYKSEKGAKTPEYRFSSFTKNKRLWMYVYGRRVRAEYSIEDFMPGFIKYSSEYLDEMVMTEPKTIMIDGKTILKATGRRKEFPGMIYLYYQALHCGSIIDYTYCFKDNLSLEDESAKAEEIFRCIDFTDIEIVHDDTMIKTETLSQDDCVTDDKSIDIQSANIKIHLPCSVEEVIWEQKSRSYYIFNAPYHGYRINFNLQVVYTSGSADLNEFSDDFIEDMTSHMDAGFLHKPGITTLDDRRILRAIGYRNDSPGCCHARYELIHEGARLIVTSTLPDDQREIEELEKILSDIVLY
ncbi:MAG: hypothetical protein IJ940_08805 [Bacteroidales bacterium]|nr:hypothetical protein [Bacteroidales bacterium]